MKCFIVPRVEGNTIRKKLLDDSILDTNFKIKSTEDHVLLPIKNSVSLKELLDKRIEYPLLEDSFEIHKKHPKCFMDCLNNKINNDKAKSLVKSFDIIGDIVVIEIPPDLQMYKFAIGKALFEFTKRRSVFMKKSKIKGITRTRDFEYLIGNTSSKTMHREHGCQITLDIQKVYFSPRLATERKRIADQVNDDEIIIDMFAGVGPFTVNIAKKHDVFIYAIDINPFAITYLKQNIELNNIKDKVVPIQGNAKQVLNNGDINVDRIIMNLPGHSIDFLNIAIKKLKIGGILNYYEFSKDYDDPIKHIIDAAYPREVIILDKKKVKSSSPGVWHIAVDAKIN